MTNWPRSNFMVVPISKTKIAMHVNELPPDDFWRQLGTFGIYGVVRGRPVHNGFKYNHELSLNTALHSVEVACQLVIVELQKLFGEPE